MMISIVNYDFLWFLKQKSPITTITWIKLYSKERISKNVKRRKNNNFALLQMSFPVPQFKNVKNNFACFEM